MTKPINHESQHWSSPERGNNRIYTQNQVSPEHGRIHHMTARADAALFRLRLRRRDLIEERHLVGEWGVA